MKNFLILLSLLFCNVLYADTINLNWYVGDNLYQTTTCEIGGGVTLPTEPTKYGYDFIGWSEIFNRGTFANWASVPTSASGYIKDAYDNKTPKENDYMVVSDSSDYAPTTSFVTDGTYINYNIDGYKGTLKITDIPSYRIHIGEFNQFDIRHDQGQRLYVYCNLANTYKTSPSATTYITTGSACINENPGSRFSLLFYRDGGGYQGTWIFRYSGTWLTDGKSGWVPEKRLD